MCECKVKKIENGKEIEIVDNILYSTIDDNKLIFRNIKMAHFEKVLPKRKVPLDQTPKYDPQGYKITLKPGAGFVARDEGSWVKIEKREESNAKEKTASSENTAKKEEVKQYEILMDKIQEAERK